MFTRLKTFRWNLLKLAKKIFLFFARQTIKLVIYFPLLIIHPRAPHLAVALFGHALLLNFAQLKLHGLLEIWSMLFDIGNHHVWRFVKPLIKAIKILGPFNIFGKVFQLFGLFLQYLLLECRIKINRRKDRHVIGIKRGIALHIALALSTELGLNLAADLRFQPIQKGALLRIRTHLNL